MITGSKILIGTASAAALTVTGTVGGVLGSRREDRKDPYSVEMISFSGSEDGAKSKKTFTLYAHQNTEHWPIPNESDTEKDEYGLDLFACAKTMFKDAPMPKNGLKAEEKAPSKSSADLEKEVMVAPKDDLFRGGNYTHGCLLMQMQMGGGKFVFRSEMVIKTDKVGMALWVGAREVEDVNKSDHIRLKVNHRVVFLSREGTDQTWKVEAGYSMRRELPENYDNGKGAEKVIIRFPEGNGVDYSFYINAIKDGKMKETSFGGLLNTSETKNSTDLRVGDGGVFDANDKAIEFAPFTLLGHDKADKFFYRDKEDKEGEN